MHRVLFLSYWGFSEGLTQATVLPHLEILAKKNNISKIVLCTIERGNNHTPQAFKNPKIIHIPFVSSWKFSRITNKIYDFIILPQRLKTIVENYKINTLIARGAPTGALALKVINKKIQFVVESFEPHAQYMLDSGVWNKNGLSYNLEKYWEQEIIVKADQILTVSNSYKTELEKISPFENKYYSVPCAVNQSLFEYSKHFRNEVRNELNIPSETIVGIYVGKFGGLYFELEQAVDLFNNFLKKNLSFKIIILSPDYHSSIKSAFAEHDISENSFVIKSSAHQDVAKYLSAADFAFANYKPSESKKALSPIKIGEYWANGLPILIPKDIGDDSDIIFQNKIGSELYINDFERSTEELLNLVQEKTREEWAKVIVPFANRYRSFTTVAETYNEILR